ncbi:MAG: response regulator, partial [Lachnospiraceae bacterium]|nr:response regulator [Lachnospiraceae bacterium]
MPVMNGYDSTRAIRALEREDAQTIPIIAMTANAFAEDEKEALAAGMNVHLAKPIDIELLRQVISQYTKQEN